MPETAHCRHCGHEITKTGTPGIWRDSNGALCEKATTGIHRP